MSIVLDNHPIRISLTNELHARPFEPMRAPGRVLHLALKHVSGAAERDFDADRAHLIVLLDRHGLAHPASGASHHSADVGRFRLRWEQHTEFVSYTLYETGVEHVLFSTDLMAHFPQEWLEEAPGSVISAIQVELIEVEGRAAAEDLLKERLAKNFVEDSLAAAWALQDTALIAGDFRIHEGGFTRFAVVLSGDAGPRRLGRVCQQLIEIEVYRLLAMLALPIARDTARRLNEIERDLSELIGQIASEDADSSESEILGALTALSAEIEALAATAGFRFGAGAAYEAIVHERISVLNEDRVGGRQQFSEFMVRRFDPAMRTVHAAERRLDELAVRASRTAELLRTRVDVALEAQNQRVLLSMDKRAGMQLRLQQTVEGFSIVAISYYAVSLLAYVADPVGSAFGVDKKIVTAAVTVPVVLFVWWFVTRMRRKAQETSGSGEQDLSPEPVAPRRRR